MLLSAPKKLPAAPESPKLCSYTCGAQCTQGRACPALSCRTGKSDGFFFVFNSENLSLLRDSRPASLVCLSTIQSALPQEPDPSQNEGGFYSLRHWWQGKTASCKVLAFAQVGNALGGQRVQATSLLIFEAKTFVKLKGQEARLLCMVLLPRPEVWGEIYFQTFAVFLS